MERQRPKSPMGGQETKVAYNGQSKVKSSLRENNNDQSYLWVDGRTKPPMSALVKNLSLSTFGWTDELSHS